MEMADTFPVESWKRNSNRRFGNGRSEFVAINDSGVIVGAVASGGRPFRAAAWVPTRLVVMPELPGTQTSAARDVNSSGHVLVGAW